MPDRRVQSPWTPQFLVSVAVTLGGFVWQASQFAAKIETVNTNVTDVRDRLKRLEDSANTYDRTSITLAKDQADIIRRLEQVESYDIARRLAVVEAKSGVPPPTR